MRHMSYSLEDGISSLYRHHVDDNTCENDYAETFWRAVYRVLRNFSSARCLFPLDTARAWEKYSLSRRALCFPCKLNFADILT